MHSDSEKEEYQRWIETVNTAWKKGWVCKVGWVFSSPKGICHDLSAADLNQLDKIEKEGLFIL